MIAAEQSGDNLNPNQEWQQALEFAGLTPQEKVAAEYLFNDVFLGEPEVKIYAFENFQQMCEAQDLRPEEIQEKVMARLSEEQVQRLFNTLVKGMQVTLTHAKYSDGRSRHRTNFFRKLVEGSGLYDSDGETVFKLPDDEAAEYLEQHLSDKSEVVEQEETVWIVAEQIQHYGRAGSVFKDQSGELVSHSVKDLTKFIVVAVDRELAVRRPRELYIGREVNVWVPELSSWVGANITRRQNPFNVEVRFHEPIKVVDTFGEIRDQETMLVQVGVAPNYDAETKSIVTVEGIQDDSPDVLPLGSSVFEAHPYAFENISLDLTSERHPEEDVPEPFRTGTLIRFSTGAIGEVIDTSTQGFSTLSGVSSSLEATDSYDQVPWIGMDDEDLPEILDKVAAEHDFFSYRTIVISMADLDGSGLEEGATRGSEERSIIFKIKGVYETTGGKKVILEALPAGLSNAVDATFTELDFDKFERLQKNEKLLVGTKPVTQEFKERFGSEAEKILSNLRDDGSATCSIELVDGTTLNPGAVYFHSLPWGVWRTLKVGHQPSFLPFDDVKSFTFYSAEDFKKYVFG